jgi:hypothetical protein
MKWAIFWAIFSQIHLVTLVSSLTGTSTSQRWWRSPVERFSVESQIADRQNVDKRYV